VVAAPGGEGGFLPVVADVTDVVRCGAVNRVCIWVNNDLNESTLPCGTHNVLSSGRKIVKPYFDFFNYSGIQRSVYLVMLPAESIQDYEVSYTLDGADAQVDYKVFCEGAGEISVQLLDAENKLVAEANGAESALCVQNAHLWQVRNAYLYTIVITLKKDGGTAEITIKNIAAYEMDFTKEEILAKIATMTGGRAAEEVVFNSITTGASNDIEQATKMARAMITRYGMTDDFDMVALETVNNAYLGGDASLACSERTAATVDDKVVEVVKQQHEKAKQMLIENRGKLDEIAKYLYEKETITGEEFMRILTAVPQLPTGAVEQ